jgi:hypothetical protein
MRGPMLQNMSRVIRWYEVVRAAQFIHDLLIQLHTVRKLTKSE